jgi:RNA polymerase sigma factor (sigma-70 family)
MTARIEDFERHRSRLFSLAYRMLGSLADAEDVVQEAYLRWQEAPETEVRSPKSYLSAVVTRLSIDRLRSARAQREDYVGPWLPEPLLSERVEDAGDPTELDESLSMAFLVLLESLNPVERSEGGSDRLLLSRILRGVGLSLLRVREEGRDCGGGLLRMSDELREQVGRRSTWACREHR